MRTKFIYFLFIGFLSTFIGSIKGEEICFYSNTKEHRRCKKKELKAIPKYPIENFHSNLTVMGPGIINSYQLSPGNTVKVIEFKAPNKDVLKVSLGTKSIPSIRGLHPGTPWVNKRTFDINPKQIIYLKKRDDFNGGWPVSTTTREYIFRYLDNYGEVESIKFERIIINNKKNQFYDFLGDYLLHASNLKWGEEIQVKSKREKILKENEKFLTITKSIILDRNNSTNQCFLAKDSKFPELAAKYKKLSKTINPLRAKLDLPQSAEFKPICN